MSAASSLLQSPRSGERVMTRKLVYTSAYLTLAGLALGLAGALVARLRRAGTLASARSAVLFDFSFARLPASLACAPARRVAHRFLAAGALTPILTGTASNGELSVSLSMGFLRSCASCTPSCPAFIASQCTDNFAPGGLGGPGLQVSGRVRQGRRARGGGDGAQRGRPRKRPALPLPPFPRHAPAVFSPPRRRAWRCRWRRGCWSCWRARCWPF